MIGKTALRGARLASAVGACAALFGGAPPAYADEASERKAEELFDEGRRLMMDPGKLEDACRTLAESYKLHERGDTLLNMAECHSRQGKTATAWAEFNRAIGVGEAVKFNEAMEVAKQRRDSLAERLSRLTVTVPPALAALDGFVLELNGAPLPREQWNKAEVRDPGPVEVTASAKGHVRFSARVELGADRDAKAIVVTLERQPSPPKPAAPAPPPARPTSPDAPLWPWIVGGVGLGLVGVAIGFGVDVANAGDELDQRCGTDRKACPRDYDFAPARSREVTGFGAFVGLGAGGVLAVGAAGVGLGLWATSRPEGPRTSVYVSPTSIGMHGSFQ